MDGRCVGAWGRNVSPSGSTPGQQVSDSPREDLYRRFSSGNEIAYLGYKLIIIK
jgi:hypothetical protein